jgi:hypothetical protein
MKNLVGATMNVFGRANRAVAADAYARVIWFDRKPYQCEQ